MYQSQTRPDLRQTHGFYIFDYFVSTRDQRTPSLFIGLVYKNLINNLLGKVRRQFHPISVLRIKGLSFPIFNPRLCVVDQTRWYNDLGFDSNKGTWFFLLTSTTTIVSFVSDFWIH